MSHRIMARRGALLIGAAFVAALAVPHTAHSQSRSKLAQGHIHARFVEVEGYDTPKAIVKAVINAPPKKVWSVVGDCHNYKKTFNRVSNSKLIKKQGNKHICLVEVDMPFPLSDLTAITSAIHKEGPEVYSRKWHLLRGDYTINSGSWTLKPFDEAGTRTLVHYTLHAEPNTAVPDWVRLKAQESTFPKMIERLREEVAKR